MENNVHHDVYNADVCTRATKREGGGEGNAEGEEREKDRNGTEGWGEQSGVEREEESRRGEHG